MKPTFSIITPTIGRESLREAIESALPQMAVDDELIVVGDGPRPAARSIVESFADPRVTYRDGPHTSETGCAQRNFAIHEIASKQYLMFLDDDNVFFSDALGTVREIVDETHIDCFIFRVKLSSHGDGFLWNEEGLTRYEDTGAIDFDTGCIVIKREPIETLALWTYAGTPETGFVSVTAELRKTPAACFRPEVIIDHRRLQTT